MDKQGKIRLDLLMTERGLAASREKARALILAGQVVVGEHCCTKAGTLVSKDVVVRIKKELVPFVSRGGVKLSAALDAFGFEPRGYVCLDVGASTGGFTDCLLQRGAQKVYAVDVGTNQLDWSLRSDARVVSIEQCHIKDLCLEQIIEPLDLIVADLSFISLVKVIPYLSRFCTDNTRMLLLVKPQFEVGREQVGKKGVVRSAKVQLEAVQRVRQSLSLIHI